MITKTAATLLTLTNRDTWAAFAWNRSECGLADAWETLWEDVDIAADRLYWAWEGHLADR